MQRYFLLLLCLFCSIGCSKDNPTIQSGVFELQEITSLPSVLKEASGLEIKDNTYWSFNDNSGKKELYQFDKTGSLVNTFSINAKRQDWEDIAQDKAGNLYLGDFGNNDNDRKDLRIYKIEAADLISNATIEPTIIHFSLEDQSQFPPPKTQRSFDVEALIALNDYLYLFTKDRSKPFLGNTKVYQLSTQVGTHTATLLGLFTTDSKSAKGAITSADNSPNNNKIALLSNQVIWVFSNFTGTNFFDGTIERFDLPIQRQMEGLVFEDDCTLLLINEHTDKQSGQLYRVTICK